MADLNLRGVEDWLVRQLKSNASLAGKTLKEYCVEILEGKIWVGVGNEISKEGGKKAETGEDQRQGTSAAFEAVEAPGKPVRGDSATSGEESFVEICDYRERDLERGCWVHCGLQAHPLKPRAHGGWYDDGSLYE